MSQDIVRVIRIVQYVGPRDLVEEQIKKSIHGTRTFFPKYSTTGRLDPISITSVTLGDFPESLPSWYTDAQEIDSGYQPFRTAISNVDIERNDDGGLSFSFPQEGNKQARVILARAFRLGEKVFLYIGDVQGFYFLHGMHELIIDGEVRLEVDAVKEGGE